MYILLHLKRANVNYVKMIAKMIELSLELVKTALDDLMKAGLVERDQGSALKRSKAKFKKAFEVRKHHTYYKLSREGDLLVRRIDERWLRENLTVPYDLFKALMKTEDFKSACKEAGFNESEFFEEFLLHRLITPSGKKTKFFKMLTTMLSDRLIDLQ
ncbi:DUF2250 domain-containing protein [Archaeoglobus profundus]|uniref:DUF2250 domain-containing protein n=1 Tax=Archaeoglobus profundus TaxID=84156 RepID=UPI001C9D7608|nr:DUF2250 domain-containing protein [Archaeoglobus profundus]